MLLIKHIAFWLVAPVFGNPVQLSDTKQTRPLLLAKGRAPPDKWTEDAPTWQLNLFKHTMLSKAVLSYLEYT